MSSFTTYTGFKQHADINKIFKIVYWRNRKSKNRMIIERTNS